MNIAPSLHTLSTPRSLLHRRLTVPSAVAMKLGLAFHESPLECIPLRVLDSQVGELDAFDGVIAMLGS